MSIKYVEAPQFVNSFNKSPGQLSFITSKHGFCLSKQFAVGIVVVAGSRIKHVSKGRGAATWRFGDLRYARLYELLW